MKLIVGLGNPGTEYADTRHNVGFKVIDRVADSCSVKIDRAKFKALVVKTEIHGQPVLLMKPQTYMNLSGEAVRQAMDFYKLDASDLLVIYDDMDLKTGQLRLREKGSAGGHNGIKSIIAHAGTQEFDRIRVGIGPRGQIQAMDFVLGRFRSEEKDLMDRVFDRAAKAVIAAAYQPFDKVMGEFNGTVE